MEIPLNSHKIQIQLKYSVMCIKICVWRVISCCLGKQNIWKFYHRSPIHGHEIKVRALYMSIHSQTQEIWTVRLCISGTDLGLNWSGYYSHHNSKNSITWIGTIQSNHTCMALLHFQKMKDFILNLYSFSNEGGTKMHLYEVSVASP